MLRAWHVVSIGIAFGLVSQPTHACIMDAPLELGDVKYADVVVVGRVSDYRIIRDLEFRKQMFANPNLSPNEREIYEKPGGLLPDYARFNVQVDEILKGKVAHRFSVTWDNSTFSEPDEMDAGPYLIALRDPSSKMPPLRGPSATILPNKESGTLTLLQAPCSTAFIFPAADPSVGEIRRILSGENETNSGVGNRPILVDNSKTASEPVDQQAEPNDVDATK